MNQSINKRVRVCSIVLKSGDVTPSEFILNSGFEVVRFAYILHNREFVEPHYHLYIEFRKSYTVKDIVNKGKFNFTQISLLSCYMILLRILM